MQGAPQFNSWVGKIRWRRDRLPTPIFLGFPCGSAGKESARNARDLGSIPGLGRSPRDGKDYPLQCSGLENSMGCIVHGGHKESDTAERLSLSGRNFFFFLPSTYRHSVGVASFLLSFFSGQFF